MLKVTVYGTELSLLKAVSDHHEKQSCYMLFPVQEMGPSSILSPKVYYFLKARALNVLEAFNSFWRFHFLYIATYILTGSFQVMAGMRREGE